MGERRERKEERRKTIAYVRIMDCGLWIMDYELRYQIINERMFGGWDIILNSSELCERSHNPPFIDSQFISES
jgi:hypothetical protein